MARAHKHKYIFVIGGVMSGVGKGVTTASIAMLLQAKGFKVNPIKVDPYLNVDAGTMNPTEHGEVFVLNSGLECDQDMGNYERFLNLNLGNDDYITSGMVYRHVIDKERALGYKGKCVEALPHIPNEILRRIDRAVETSGSDVSVIEVGGTVGDYQNIMFLEAARRLWLTHRNDVIFILVSYLPVPGTIGEMKTKPTQNAVRLLNSYGIQQDFIIALGPVPLDEKRKEKLAIWCNTEAERVISAPDIESIYDVPLNFEKDNISSLILSSLNLKSRVRRDGFEKWKKFVSRTKNAKEELSIAVIGKYFDTGDFMLSDAYLSVIEAVKHAAAKLGKKAVLSWLNANDYDHKSEDGLGKKEGSDISSLKQYDGIIVPGGFGEAGIEGKIKVIQFVRENKIPYFGLCYGMQLAVIEYARNVAGLLGAHTTEINKEALHKVIDIMPEQKKHMEEGKYGATMRLGAYEARVKDGTIARKVYGKEIIYERHRHRYEVNPEYIGHLEKVGMIFSATSPNGVLMEIAELPRKIHPFFLGTQFHPEFQSRPLVPHPLFTEFLKSASARRNKNK